MKHLLIIFSGVIMFAAAMIIGFDTVSDNFSIMSANTPDARLMIMMLSMILGSLGSMLIILTWIDHEMDK